MRIREAGADIAVQSLHKADGGLCQASVIMLCGDLVDPVNLRLRLDLITTTSPSALLYGSIDVGSPFSKWMRTTS